MAPTFTVVGSKTNNYKYICSSSILSGIGYVSGIQYGVPLGPSCLSHSVLSRRHDGSNGTP